MSGVVVDDHGTPRPDCHPSADIEVTRELPSDTGVYMAEKLTPSDKPDVLDELQVVYIKVYEGVLDSDFVVKCAMCGQPITGVEVFER